MFSVTYSDTLSKASSSTTVFTALLPASLLTCCLEVFVVSNVTVVLVDVGGWMGLLWGEASWTRLTGVTTGYVQVK